MAATTPPTNEWREAYQRLERSVVDQCKVVLSSGEYDVVETLTEVLKEIKDQKPKG